MIKAYMNVRRIELATGGTEDLGSGHHSLAVLDGELAIGADRYQSGQGGYCASGGIAKAAGPSVALCFSLTRDAPSVPVDLLAELDLPQGSFVFRLDQVSFPPGAIAYRHVHAGSGIRYLIKGSLKVASDHDAPTMSPGDAWFEGADSPVRATASQSDDTAFVRAMVLPMEYLGKPTIKYLNREDDDKPRNQSNLRFFDQEIS